VSEGGAHTDPWTTAQIPDLTGRRALVTGVTSGLGRHTALELARKGAEVLLAARNQDRLAAVTEDLRRVLPSAALVPLLLDLADLASVRRAAGVAATHGPLHILVNNAGVMATPQRRTVDGFELQIGTNHLGHFALTGLLWPALVAAQDSAQGARVVTVSSQMARRAQSVDLADPRRSTGRYRKWNAYAQSKLANLLFAFEVERRAGAAGTGVSSLAAHPGLAATALFRNGLGMSGRFPVTTMLDAVTRLVAQSPAQGALPLLRAATDRDLPGGTYVGPGGPAESRGAPRVVHAPRVARDPEAAARLWRLSEAATGVRFLS
jgi:NAD(P)-dependent dehydrogenase (short-subunit alcohol dehydrogenase family)